MFILSMMSNAISTFLRMISNLYQNRTFNVVVVVQMFSSYVIKAEHSALSVDPAPSDLILHWRTIQRQLMSIHLDHQHE